MVHLPDVRFCAHAVGRLRGHHPLAVHAGVRRSPPALRLVPRSTATRESAATDRVFAAEPGVHDYQQAQAQQLDRTGRRERLGRSAHADDRRHAPARLPGGGVARFRQARRRDQERQAHRDGRAGKLCQGRTR